MTLGLFIKRCKEFNIPDDVVFQSDSGWECGPTDMDAIYYNKENNTLTFEQGISNFDLLHHTGEICIYFGYSNKRVEYGEYDDGYQGCYIDTDTETGEIRIIDMPEGF